jgi:hypothetical protein
MKIELTKDQANRLRILVLAMDTIDANVEDLEETPDTSSVSLGKDSIEVLGALPEDQVTITLSED